VVEDDRSHLWAVVLAGGHGTRLRPLTRRIYGEPRPRQFASIAGDRPMLGDTLARAALVVPIERGWREEGRLPLPDFPPEDIRDLRDTIDYPPARDGGRAARKG
jgi:hypothetical protein